jgi:hypothetical protein
VIYVAGFPARSIDSLFLTRSPAATQALRSISRPPATRFATRLFDIPAEKLMYRKRLTMVEMPVQLPWSRSRRQPSDNAEQIVS